MDGKTHENPVKSSNYKHINIFLCAAGNASKINYNEKNKKNKCYDRKSLLCTVTIPIIMFIVPLLLLQNNKTMKSNPLTNGATIAVPCPKT